MTQKVFRTGNSLAVTIPSGFASVVGVRAGDKVNVKEIRERAKVILEFSGNQQLLLDTSFLKSRRK